MFDEMILANARLILENEVVHGALHISDGIITALDQGNTVPPGADDMEGDYLAPGLVELHTDNVERHISPRPNVDWPHKAAIVAHDRELAGTGITTVFDAIRVGSILSIHAPQYGKYARQMADEILAMRAAGALRISHHLHLRAETCSETLIEELDEFGAEDRVGIVSMMDHTPGQRQFRDIEKYRDYMCGKHGLDQRAFDDHVKSKRDLHDRLGAAHEAATVAAAKRYGAVLASHDDSTADQVAQSHAHGVTVAEFPTTVEAADACHAHDIVTIMGAPNIVRGGSHSGNVAALELASVDRLDILSSDYVPAGLLVAAMQLAAHWDNIPRAIGTVTRAPARAAGLTDRGQLAPGLRADLIRFAEIDGFPLLKRAWSAGVQVA